MASLSWCLQQSFQQKKSWLSCLSPPIINLDGVDFFNYIYINNPASFIQRLSKKLALDESKEAFLEFCL